MKLKMKKRILGVITVAVLAISTTVVSFAGKQWCNKSGEGYKNYKSSVVKTGWSGTLTGISNHIFKDDECIFKGNSYSRWMGGNPYNADKIVHYDIIEIKGTGSVSFSGGVGANASGPTATMGISGTKSGKSNTYAYEIVDDWRISIDYSYYADIYDWDWMDLFTAASFKFGSKFVVVNSRVDNPTTSTGKIYYK